MRACRQKRSGSRRPYTQRMTTLLLWPLRPPAAWILGLFILLGWLLLAAVDLFDDLVPMALALIFGFELPLWYLLLGSLCLAAQMRLLHHARGLAHEPMADETNLNPFGNGLAFRFFVLLAIPLGVLQWQAAAPSPAIIALLAIVYPLPWLSLMLEASAREAFRPTNLWRLVKGVGIGWVGTCLLISGGVGYLMSTLLWLHNPFHLAAAGYGFLLAHGVAGRLLWGRRQHLDLYVKKSPELAQGAELAARNAELDRLMEDLHRLCGAGRVAEAHKRLESHLVTAGSAGDDAVHQRLLQFTHQDLLLEHAVHYLGRLLENGKRQQAWALFKSCHAREPRFRPLTDESLLTLVSQAAAEDGPLAEELLADFPDAYPDSHLIANARFRLARLMHENWHRHDEAIAVLREIRATHPAFAATEQFRNLVLSIRDR